MFDLAVDDVDADLRQLVGRLGECLGDRRVELEVRELAAAADLEGRVREVLGPLDQAVHALVLGVEQRQARVVFLEHAVVVLEHAEGEVAAAVVALDPELQLRARELVRDRGLERQLGVVGVRLLLAVEELRIAQVLGIVRHRGEQADDVLVGLVEEGEQAVGVGDARGVEVEVEVVHPVGLGRLELRLVVAELDVPGMPVSEAGLIAGHEAVVRLAEGVELVGLLRFCLELAVVVLGRELAPDLGFRAVRVHVEGAQEPLGPLAEGLAQVAGPGDVLALALVRVFHDRCERRLHAALAVERALEFPCRLAVEALLVVAAKCSRRSCRCCRRRTGTRWDSSRRRCSRRPAGRRRR